MTKENIDLGIVLIPPLKAISNRAIAIYSTPNFTGTVDDSINEAIKQFNELRELEIWNDKLDMIQSERRIELLKLFGFMSKL